MGFYTRLPRRGRMPLTLPWKGRCAVYQLTVAVATQMSHKLVYGADELHFLKALALVVWFSKRCISTGEVRSYGFKLAFPDGEGEPLRGG